MQKRYRRGETEANTKGGTEEAKGGEEMTKGEYQRYRRIVLGFFPLYLDYLFYRRPRKCKLKKVVNRYKGAKM